MSRARQKQALCVSLLVAFQALLPGISGQAEKFNTGNRGVYGYRYATMLSSKLTYLHIYFYVITLQ